MDKIKSLIKLIRPHHSLKNLLIFAPVFFALKIRDIDLLVKCLIAVVIFSLIASSIYIINDYKDIEQDKLHPKKKERPLASGKVSKKEAIIFFILIAVVGFASAYIMNKEFFLLAVFYFFMNIAYSFKLKHIALLDVFILATGFVIRILVGSAVTGVELSMWIVILIFLLALFLALAKRRDDVLIFETTGKKTRKSVDGYNEDLLNAMMTVSVSVTIVTYIMYTISADIISKFHEDKLYITAFFVILAVFRYMQLTFVGKKSGSPVEVLMKDIFIQLTVIAWIISFGLLIYL
jgi:decaprenyl-phosphate phosphoribosyltransferase